MPVKFLPIITLIFAFLLGGFKNSALAQSPSRYDFDASRVHWSTLSFKSKSVFGKAISKAKLEEFHVSSAEISLITPPQGVALKPSGPEIFTLTVNSTIDPIFGSNDFSETKVWFIPEQAAGLQRVRLRIGGEKWQKIYRWTEKGVYRLRKKPADYNEEKLTQERWTNVTESFYPYDSNSNGCLFVSDPSLLLYLASAANLSIGGQPLSLCVFNKKQLHHVEINAARALQIEGNYLEKSSLNESRKEGKIDVMKLSIKTHSLTDQKEEAEPFSFLKLKGDFDIYIEKTTRIPILIKGKASKFGNLDIKLQEVELKPITNYGSAL